MHRGISSRRPRFVSLSIIAVPVDEADMCGAQAAKDYRERLSLSDTWLLTHRVDLHNALRAAAAKKVNGRRVQIRLASRVATVVGYVAGPAFYSS